MYGYRFAEEWLDIGDPAQLLEADNRYRARAGLPRAGSTRRRTRIRDGPGVPALIGQSWHRHGTASGVP